jgi:hypothetical protein
MCLPPGFLKEKLMRKIATLTALAVAIVVVAGCNKPPVSSVEGSGGRKIVVADIANQTLKRDSTNKVMITVTRTNISDPLDVTFENLPKGVSLVEAPTKIAANENVVNFTLKIDANADLVTNHEVKATVSHADIKVSRTFNVTVKEK